MADTPNIRTIHAGRWVHYRVVDVPDGFGRIREWEYVDRAGMQPGALAIPICRPSGDVILIRQYRPPLGADAVEFPAGLVDEGETPAQAAIRELREETGYRGEADRVSARVGSSCGLTSEQVYLVDVEIDENHPENRDPQPMRTIGEQTTVLRVPYDELAGRLEAWAARGWVVDARVWAWVTGGVGR